MLCDCPGLVYPNFAATKAEMVCNGILPIDQLKDPFGPSALVRDPSFAIDERSVNQ